MVAASTPAWVYALVIAIIVCGVIWAIFSSEGADDDDDDDDQSQWGVG